MESTHQSNMMAKMSEFVGGRSIKECHDQYMNSIQRMKDVDKGILKNKQCLFVNEKDVELERKRIETFYQEHRKMEFNALNNKKYTQIEFS